MRAYKINSSGVLKELVGLLKRFFLPFGKRSALTLVCVGAILLAIYLEVVTGVPELVRQNCRPTLRMLAAEVIDEAGPFARASGSHAEILRKYVKHMEERPLSLIVRWLYPKYSPRKQLNSVQLALENSPDDEEGAREVIRAAGEKINDFCEKAYKFSDRQIVWFKTERLPQWLVTDLSNSLENSHTMVKRLENELSVESALTTCESNRESILLLCLTRLGYEDEEKIRAFLEDVRKAYKYTTIVANKQGDEEAKGQILEWAESEERRIKILEARLTKDLDEVERLLRETIEIAFEKENVNATE